GGLSVSPGDQLVMYTWGGDANLDGTLNGDDYFRIDSHVSQSGSVFGYHNGDFNYDGLINGDDYFIIDSNIATAQSSPPFPTASGVAASAAMTPVPGPTSVMMVAASMLLAPLRRRRRKAVALALAAGVGAAAPALADTWDNFDGNGLWSDGNNWLDNTEPASASDVANFPNTIPLGQAQIFLGSGEICGAVVF